MQIGRNRAKYLCTRNMINDERRRLHMEYSLPFRQCSREEYCIEVGLLYLDDYQTENSKILRMGITVFL